MRRVVHSAIPSMGGTYTIAEQDYMRLSIAECTQPIKFLLACSRVVCEWAVHMKVAQGY